MDDNKPDGTPRRVRSTWIGPRWTISTPPTWKREIVNDSAADGGPDQPAN